MKGKMMKSFVYYLNNRVISVKTKNKEEARQIISEKLGIEPSKIANALIEEN